MEIKFSRNIPNKMEKVINGILLRYNIVETPMEEIVKKWKEQRMDSDEEPDAEFIQEHKYMYNELRILHGRISYEGVVEEIIRDKYSADEMEAITNNMNVIVSEFFATLVSEGIISATKYLVNSANNEQMANFKEMQEWRNNAKKIAKEIFK